MMISDVTRGESVYFTDQKLTVDATDKNEKMTPPFIFKYQVESLVHATTRYHFRNGCVISWIKV